MTVSHGLANHGYRNMYYGVIVTAHEFMQAGDDLGSMKRKPGEYIKICFMLQ